MADRALEAAATNEVPFEALPIEARDCFALANIVTVMEELMKLTEPASFLLRDFERSKALVRVYRNRNDPKKRDVTVDFGYDDIRGNSREQYSFIVAVE